MLAACPPAEEAEAAFVQGSSIPTFGEVLTTGPQQAARWARLDQAMTACHSATINVPGQKAPLAITPFEAARVCSPW